VSLGDDAKLHPAPELGKRILLARHRWIIRIEG
jgi:hypothetical protein